MNPFDRDQLVGEIHRLQKLLDQVQDHLTALASSASEAERSHDLLTRACVDEAYAELELAKRVPSADAWQAIKKATAAVGRLAGPDPGEARRAYLPAVRLTVFVSTSSASLRALRVVQDVAARLGHRASVEVCDVARDPGRAERAGVVFTPVLRIERAGAAPVTVFGALDHREQLLERLMLAGLSVEQGSEAGSASPPGAESAEDFTSGSPTADRD
jgi:hypothetical protein